MILQRYVEAPFIADSRVRWSWNVKSLPSVRAEDSRTTHDYLSLAVEFDNGQDLTYMWSAALEPEFSFRCPIATWRDRETHVVIRSGRENLGRWIAEERDLWRDYQNAIGSPPDRIVGLPGPNSRPLVDRRQHLSARSRALRVSRYQTGHAVRIILRSMKRDMNDVRRQ
jgi:hypothetical protein